MKEDRSFYKLFFSMLFVLVLQNILTIAVNLADNMMLGAYSESALAGAAAVNQIQFVYQQLLMAAGEGIVIVGSQYFGKKEYGPIRLLSSLVMRLGLALSVVLFVLAACIPQVLVSFFTNDPAIIREGVQYLNIIKYTYVFFAVTQVLVGTLRSVGNVNVALYLSVIALVLNGGINYVLIYGRFGAPRLGIVGAAIGTLTARIAEMLFMIFYILRREHVLHLRPSHFRHTDPALTRDYFHVSIPLIVVEGLWGLNQACQNAILGHMSSHCIAANSVAVNLFTLVKSGGIGTTRVASFLVGKMIGEGDETVLRKRVRTMQILFIGIGLVSAVILFFLRIPILGLYQLEPETRRLANQFLIVLSVICVTMNYQMPVNVGIIKGGGDTRYVLINDLISIWCIVLPVSFIMAFVVHASPLVVICCLNADQVFKCIPGFFKVNYGHWAKKLTR